MNMRQAFEAAVPNSNKFIYLADRDEYIHQDILAKDRRQQSDAFNEQWFYWKSAWAGGQKDMDFEIDDKLVTDILDTRYGLDLEAGCHASPNLPYRVGGNFDDPVTANWVTRLILLGLKSARSIV